MMHHVHTGEAVVTTQKIDIFWLVTTRLIAHSGQSECVRNCVGEFGHQNASFLLSEGSY